MEQSEYVTVDDNFYEILKNCKLEKDKNDYKINYNGENDIQLLIKLTNCQLFGLLDSSNLHDPSINYGAYKSDCKVIADILGKIHNIVEKKVNLKPLNSFTSNNFLCTEIKSDNLITKIEQKYFNGKNNKDNDFDVLVDINYCTLGIMIRRSHICESKKNKYYSIQFCILDIGNPTSSSICTSNKVGNTKIHFTTNYTKSKEIEKSNKQVDMVIEI
jgi:hypothetical protein